MAAFNLDDIFATPSTKNMNVAPPSFDSMFDEEPLYRSLSVITPAPMSATSGLYDFDGFSREFSANPSTMASVSMVPSKPSLRKQQQPVAVAVATVQRQDPVVSLAPRLPEGFPVEASHFHSSSPLSLIVSSLQNALSAVGASVEEFNEEKCKFKCSSGSTRFVVRVFSVQESMLVEFQKRSGASGAFSAIYDQLMAELRTIVDAGKDKSAQSLSQWIPTPGRLSFMERQKTYSILSSSVVAEDLLPLVEMLRSDYVDSQTSALRVVASLADVARNAGSLQEAGVVAATVELLNSPSHSVLLGAISVLSNFAQRSSCEDGVMAQVVAKLMGLLSASSCEQLTRECARAVAVWSFHEACASFLARGGYADALRLVIRRTSDQMIACRSLAFASGWS